MRVVPDEEVELAANHHPLTGCIVAGLHEHRSQHHVMSDDPAYTERWRRVVSL
jgi:hypothetical protein